MKIIETFKKAIVEGMEAAVLIEKASERAEAYAAIANAIAVSGVLKKDALLEDELPKGKESLKPETSKKRTGKNRPVEEPVEVVEEVQIEETEAVELVEEPIEVVEEPVLEDTTEAVEEIEVVEEIEEVLEEAEETVEEVEEVEEEISAEWTEETEAQFAEEREFLEAVLSEYDEQSVADQLAWWSEGVYTTIADISPLNIAGFVAFLKAEFGE